MEEEEKEMELCLKAQLNVWNVKIFSGLKSKWKKTIDDVNPLHSKKRFVHFLKGKSFVRKSIEKSLIFK